MKTIYDEHGLPTPTSPSAEDEYLAEPEKAPVIEIDDLHESVKHLNGNQAFVIRCRYLMSRADVMTLEEISELMGVSIKRVSDIERQAITRLAKVLSKSVKEKSLSMVHQEFQEAEARETHKAHPSDWRQVFSNAGPTLEYIGPTHGWYKAPSFEDWGSDESDVCYFLHAPEVGKVKIGHTNGLRRRMYSLRSGSPVALELIGTVLGGHSREQQLHQRFREYQLAGEWYDDCIITELEEIVEEDAHS